MKYVDMSDILKDQTDIRDYNIEAIKNSIYNILSTPVGEVPGIPLFGCNINQYLFELINPLTSKLIEKEVQYALELWEPRIEVTKIEVDEDKDYNKLKILIVYLIKNNINNVRNEYLYTTQR